MKKVLLSTLVIFALWLILGGNAVFAETAVRYPEIGGETVTLSMGVAKYIRYIFLFGLGAAGVTALAVFLFGAFQYVASAGDTGKQGEAKNWMTAAISGLLVLLASYLILQAINPDLLSLNPTLKAPQAPYRQVSTTTDTCKSACMQTCEFSVSECREVCEEACTFTCEICLRDCEFSHTECREACDPLCNPSGPAPPSDICVDRGVASNWNSVPVCNMSGYCIDPSGFECREITNALDPTQVYCCIPGSSTCKNLGIKTIGNNCDPANPSDSPCSWDINSPGPACRLSSDESRVYCCF